MNSLYTYDVTDCLKPAVTSLIFIHQHLKTTQIHVFNFLNCARVKDYLHNSENLLRSPLECSNWVFLSFTLRILGFHNN